MMMNESEVTVESKPPECRLTTSGAADEIAAAWEKPLLTRTEIANRSDHTTTTTLPPGQPFNETALNNLSRKTKIIATLGPATESGDVLRTVLEAGVCAFRVNPACISRESALKAVYAIRSISTDLQRPVALLLDTQSSPGRAPDSTAIAEGDWADIRFGVECGVDWLAVPAGRDGEAVRQLRQFLAEQKRSNISILARIANPSALVALDQIIQDADGIILDSVNPASECPGAEIFLIVQKCVSARKLVVIATGANGNVAAAVAAQPDAMLIEQETSVGLSPLQGVQMLDRLIRQEEASDCREQSASVTVMTERDQKVAAAVQQAEEMKAAAIVVFTRLGGSASLCAALRPRHSRVFAFTPDARLARRLRLRYALEPVVLPFSEQPDKTRQSAEKTLVARKLLAPGSKVVFVTDVLDQGERISSVQAGTLTAIGRKAAK